MTTHYAEPNFIDYDAVQRVFRLLVQAALMKRTVIFDQVRIAIQGGESDELVLRGYGSLQEGYPSADDTLPIIQAVADACKTRGLPPLTVLVTKEGKNVGTGFWKHSPVGDLWTDYHTDHGRRQLELFWRSQCYQFFDPFSAMNESLGDYIKHVYRVAKAQPHPDKGINLYEALHNAVVPANGVNGPVTNTQKHRWIREHFVFNENHDEIVDHDLAPDTGGEMADVAARPEHRMLFRFAADNKDVNAIAVAFANHMAMGIKPTGLLEFNIKHVNLESTAYGKVLRFTESWVGTGRHRWQYNVICEIERPEDRAVVTDVIEVDVDPAGGAVIARAKSGYDYTLMAELVVSEV